MAHWVVVVPPSRYEDERLVYRDTLAVSADGPADGDAAVLVAALPEPVVFGLGRFGGPGVAYTHRVFDDPQPADGLAPGEPGVYRLDPAAFAAVAGKIGAQHRVDAPRRVWLVSVDLPIEASSRAEAVRTFWSYVQRLGPRELPAFVSPAGDELAMQAYVLGEETSLDPEEE
jgi:hypothetical protein